MPLYEYQCDACGHRFELIQKFSDPPATTCPTCGGTVRKLMSSPAIQFKGSGFYITDYPKKDQSSAKSEAGSSDSASTKDKTEKFEKSEKSGKSGKSEKSDKASASTAPASTSSSTTTNPSSTRNKP